MIVPSSEGRNKMGSMKPQTRAAERAAPPADLLRNASLFLDFDGTLVELADTPDAVRVGEETRAVVANLFECLEGRLAIVSGRSALEVGEFLGTCGCTVVGSHGLEFRFADGRTSSSDPPAELAAIVAAMRELAGAFDGVIVEPKPLGAVLHFRQCPEAEQACLDLARELSETHGLHFQTGKMMAEVRPAGGDKGSAIRRLMEEPAMRGTRPVFVGDDDTDEPGFRAVEAMGGAGILVGPERPSAARYRLADVRAAVEWLAQACPR